ncbi:MAG: hypothetical protein UY50_C0037G0005 [Parcubacteria group bacterium GW2011_GWA2_49_9]|nr:MAG: hypothetical protein UY50_C0037G0005 [Parcubacteria group bacterium GW2011_GWA2_49_9]
MKNWKDFFASGVAFALFGGVVGAMHLIVSPFIVIFLALFCSAWLISVALLALLRIYKVMRRCFVRKVPTPLPVAATLGA